MPFLSLRAPRGQEAVARVACKDRIQVCVSTTNNVGVVFQLMLRLGSPRIKPKHRRCQEANLKLCFICYCGSCGDMIRDVALE